MKRRKEFSEKDTVERSILIMIILAGCLVLAGCSRMTRIERNQKKLTALIEKNTVEIARQSATIKQNQRHMQSRLHNSQFSDNNISDRIAALERSQSKVMAKIERNEKTIARNIVGSRDAILTDAASNRDQLQSSFMSGKKEITENIIKSRNSLIRNVESSEEDVKEHVTTKSEMIGNHVSAMEEKYEDRIAVARDEARAASANAVAMKAAFGELENRLQKSFNEKFATIEEYQLALTDGIKNLQNNMDELGAEVTVMKKNQNQLEAKFVGENETFRTEVIEALERMNRMISKLNPKNESTVVAETVKEVSNLKE